MSLYTDVIDNCVAAVHLFWPLCFLWSSIKQNKTKQERGCNIKLLLMFFFIKVNVCFVLSRIADRTILQLTVNYVDLICPHVPSSYLHDLTILWGQHWTKMSISCGILSSLHRMICGQLKHPKLFQPQNNLREHILFSNYTNIELPLTKRSNNAFSQTIFDKVLKCVIGRFSRFQF